MLNASSWNNLEDNLDFSKADLEALEAPQSLNQAQAQQLVEMLDRGETIYGAFRKGAKAGTIGVLTDLQYTRWSTGDIRFKHTFQITVEGRDPYTAWGTEVGILFGYTGPTVWKFTRAAKGANDVAIIDKTGEEIEVGDLVFVAEGNRLYYGKVQRRSPVGTVWIQQVTSNPKKRLGGAHPVKCGPIRDGQIVKIDGHTLDRLMLAKLAS